MITTTKITQEELKDLKSIRNYFGENDKTSFEHLAFEKLDKLIKKNSEMKYLYFHEDYIDLNINQKIEAKKSYIKNTLKN